MGTLEYSKYIKIKNKIFAEDDILQIAHFFSEQFADGDYQREISLKFDDGSKISGQDIDVFSTSEFKRRRCESILFSYRAAHFARKIDIRIYNAEINSYSSEVEVVSTEQVWYESVVNRISTILTEVEDQKKVDKITNCAVPVLSVFESAMFCNTLYKLAEEPLGSNTQMLYSIASAVIFLMINMYLAWEFCKLYPKIEFDFGPDHRKTSQKIKKALAILIPFVIDCIFFVAGLKA